MNKAAIAVYTKLDVYMHNYILNKFDPNKIYWWFSLSGGKDSYIMSYAIYSWYKSNGYEFRGEGFCFLQWELDNESYLLLNNINWMPVIKIDVRDKTLLATNHCVGDQANCSSCSAIRKCEGDSYIKVNYKEGYTNIIARGLHLTDTAISYLWRDFWGIDTHQFASDLNKGNPLVKIDYERNLYLSKPLCYIREFEIQCLANELSINTTSKSCPLCKYPSRRDIVEETIRQLFDDNLWEFQVNGINTYVNKIGKGCSIIEASVGGKETKRACLPDEFFTYAFSFWKDRFDYLRAKEFMFGKNMKTLDESGVDYLLKHKFETSTVLLKPKIMLDNQASPVDIKMIATLGPFWGAISYENASIKEEFFALQKDMYGIEIDQAWSQVIPLLQDYYREKYGDL